MLKKELINLIEKLNEKEIAYLYTFVKKMFFNN